MTQESPGIMSDGGWHPPPSAGRPAPEFRCLARRSDASMIPSAPTPVGAVAGTGRRHRRHGSCTPWKWLVLSLLALGLLLPRLVAAQGAEYRIGPQDVLEIKVYETTEFNGDVRVSPDGRIAL